MLSIATTWAVSTFQIPQIIDFILLPFSFFLFPFSFFLLPDIRYIRPY